MSISSASRNILISGVCDAYGVKIVEGLAQPENSLILSGGSDHKQKFLRSHYPQSVKGTSDYRTLNQQMNLMATIEKQGSLDAVIYFFGYTPGSITGHHNDQDLNFSSPILLFNSIEPYLKKNGDCKVIFISSQLHSNLNDSLSIPDFFDNLCEELREKDIEVRNISYAQESKQTEPNYNMATTDRVSRSQPSIVSSVIELLDPRGLSPLSTKIEVPVIS